MAAVGKKSRVKTSKIQGPRHRSEKPKANVVDLRGLGRLSPGRLPLSLFRLEGLPVPICFLPFTLSACAALSLFFGSSLSTIFNILQRTRKSRLVWPVAPSKMVPLELDSLYRGGQFPGFVCSATPSIY